MRDHPCNGCKNLRLVEGGYNCAASIQHADFSCHETPESGHPERPSRAFAFPDNQTLTALAIPASKSAAGFEGQVTLFSYQQPVMIIGRKNMMALRLAIDYALGIEPERSPK